MTVSQPQGLFDVASISIYEASQQGIPPTLLPANVIDAEDPFSVAVNFKFMNPPLPGADLNSGWIFGIIQWLQCVAGFNVTYTVTYTADAMDSDNFYTLGSVNGTLQCAGGSLQLNYGDSATRLDVPGGIPKNGVYKLIATVTTNVPGILGFAEDVIYVHHNVQVP